MDEITFQAMWEEAIDRVEAGDIPEYIKALAELMIDATGGGAVERRPSPGFVVKHRLIVPFYQRDKWDREQEKKRKELDHRKYVAMCKDLEKRHGKS